MIFCFSIKRKLASTCVNTFCPFSCSYERFSSVIISFTLFEINVIHTTVSIHIFDRTLFMSASIKIPDSLITVLPPTCHCIMRCFLLCLLQIRRAMPSFFADTSLFVFVSLFLSFGQFLRMCPFPCNNSKLTNAQAHIQIY